jgi:butyrate kinase
MIFREIYTIKQAELKLLSDFSSKSRFVKDKLYKIIDKQKLDISSVHLTAFGSGPLKKSGTGVFSLNPDTFTRIQNLEFGEDIRHCGLLAAWDFASRYSIPAVAVFPPGADDFPVVSRVHKNPDTIRQARADVLALSYAGFKAARGNFYKKRIISLSLDIGSGAAALDCGKLIDMAIENSPMDCRDIKKLLGVLTLKEAEIMANKGHALAQAVVKAYAYQFYKAAWSMLAALDNRVDFFVISGLNASCPSLDQNLIKKLENTGPVHLVTGFDNAGAAAVLAHDAFIQGRIIDDVF